MTSFLTYPARVSMNAIQTQPKNRRLCTSERKRKRLPIICNEETTVAYHKPEVRSLLGWAALVTRRVRVGRCWLRPTVSCTNTFLQRGRTGGLLCYNTETWLECGWLRSGKRSLKYFLVSQLSRMPILRVNWLLTVQRSPRGLVQPTRLEGNCQTI